MSIVEKAADRLRQSGQDATRDPRARVPSAGRAPPGAPPDRSKDPGRDTVDRPSVSVNFSALRRAGLAPPVSLEQTVAREYQRIKRPILTNIFGRDGMSVPGGNRLMVASAVTGEGKTFTSVNLALNLARERDHSVLLVDGDVIKPTISRTLGLQDRKGLLDLLAEDTTAPEAAIVETDIPGFFVLPAGQRHEAMTELLSSQRMAWLVDELSRDPNRIVVFDSSPLLATSESQALAMAVGQIAVVVRAGVTGQRAVEAALSLIAHPDKAINLILNQSEKAHGDYYAGYYGSAYGGTDHAA